MNSVYSCVTAQSQFKNIFKTKYIIEKYFPLFTCFKTINSLKLYNMNPQIVNPDHLFDKIKKSISKCLRSFYEGKVGLLKGLNFCFDIDEKPPRITNSNIIYDNDEKKFVITFADTIDLDESDSTFRRT